MNFVDEKISENLNAMHEKATQSLNARIKAKIVYEKGQKVWYRRAPFRNQERLALARASPNMKSKVGKATPKK